MRPASSAASRSGSRGAEARPGRDPLRVELLEQGQLEAGRALRGARSGTSTASASAPRVPRRPGLDSGGPSPPRHRRPRTQAGYEPATPPSDLDLVHERRMRRVQQLERRAAGFEDRDAPVLGRERLALLEPEHVAIEAERLVVVGRGDAQPQLDGRPPRRAPRRPTPRAPRRARARRRRTRALRDPWRGSGGRRRPARSASATISAPGLQRLYEVRVDVVHEQ